MKTRTLLGALCLALSIPAAAAERDYQDVWCTGQGGEAEVVLFDRSRIDCLTDEFAVEVDYAYKWAESIGQAKYYAEMTGREPAVLLIVAPGEHRFLARFHNAAPGIRLFVVER